MQKKRAMNGARHRTEYRKEYSRERDVMVKDTVFIADCQSHGQSATLYLFTLQIMNTCLEREPY